MVGSVQKFPAVEIRMEGLYGFNNCEQLFPGGTVISFRFRQEITPVGDGMFLTVNISLQDSTDTFITVQDKLLVGLHSQDRSGC